MCAGGSTPATTLGLDRAIRHNQKEETQGWMTGAMSFDAASLTCSIGRLCPEPRQADVLQVAVEEIERLRRTDERDPSG